MVLNELADKIVGAIERLSARNRIDNNAIDELVDGVSAALAEADVNSKILSEMRDHMCKALREEIVTEQQQIGQNQAIDVRKYQARAQELVINELIRVLQPISVRDGKKQRSNRLTHDKTNIVMFVGLQGAGKTTTCAKYANYHRKRDWKVAMVCCDTFRAGAFEQLKQNCTSIKIPYYGSYTEKDPVKLAVEGVEHYKRLGFDLIILDTSGRHKQATELFNEMREIDKAVNPTERIFVMDSTIGQAAFEQAKAFKEAVDIGSVILTKLDGHARGGGAIAAVAATDAPIAFIGVGEHHDELEPFDAPRFVRRILGGGDVQAAIEAISSSDFDMERHMKTMQRMGEGFFCYRDFRIQLDNIRKLGPLDRMMDMFGMGKLTKMADESVASEREQALRRREKENEIMLKNLADEIDYNPTFEGVENPTDDYKRVAKRRLLKFRDLSKPSSQATKNKNEEIVLALNGQILVGSTSRQQDLEDGSADSVSGATKSLTKYISIIDTMTDAEQDVKADTINTDETRQRRWAVGSGCDMYEIKEMVANGKQMKNALEIMGKMMNDPQELMRNPQQMRKMLNGMGMSPQMLQEMQKGLMGAMGNQGVPNTNGNPMANMMKSMFGGSAGGMGGLANMFSGMPGMGNGMPDMNALMNQMGKGGIDYNKVAASMGGISRGQANNLKKKMKM